MTKSIKFGDFSLWLTALNFRLKMRRIWTHETGTKNGIFCNNGKAKKKHGEIFRYHLTMAYCSNGM